MLARRATYQERKSDLPTPAACLRPYSLRDVCRWNASEKDSRGRRGRLTTRPGSQSFGTLGGPSSIGLAAYFFAPTDRFLSRRSDPRHFLHLVAASGFLAPHLRHTFRNSLLFCAICFLAASAIGNSSEQPELSTFQPVGLIFRIVAERRSR